VKPSFRKAPARPGASLVCFSRLILVLFTAAATVAACPSSALAASLQTILTNGPASNRLNVTFLSEGYTSAQLGAFRSDSTNALNALLARQPFLEYQSYINAFAIAVASTQSGSDYLDPAPGIRVDTYFNSAYVDQAHQLIMIPPNVPGDTTYSRGQGKVDALLTQFVPTTDLAVLIVNAPDPGGSGGQTVITSHTSSSLEDLVPHETAHTLANLGDEYETPYPGYPDIEEPNTTRETNRTLIKWRSWIDPGTPLPTPSNLPGDAVGLFEGAHYHANGWYRPQSDCLMRSLYVPFCRICTEALVLSFYSHLRPIDGFSPRTTYITFTNNQLQLFSVTNLQPATHPLRVQWLTNGVPIPEATNPALAILPTDLGNGTNKVQVTVTDDTPMVRTDPNRLLVQSLTWTAKVDLIQMRLSSPRWLGSNRFTFQVAGKAPQGFSILGSTNLSSWVSLSTNYLDSKGFYSYTNSNIAIPWRFYRARTPPGQ
jgi:hypothetical protein